MSVGLFKLLGHRSIKTTEIYANWVRKEELERWV
jgi:site-specific recombinase XerD